MKVLLTGASGFVGSHILDQLRAANHPTVILLRPSSNTHLIGGHLDWVERRSGSFSEAQSLRKALKDITHVIHCAGCTKAARLNEFHTVNHGATSALLAVIQPGLVQRLVHISSLAAFGPAGADAPAREDMTPRPVSEYGKSKLAGEDAVRNECKIDYVILRPPAVYGPRDAEFLRLFQAVKRHVLPWPAPQPLSVVFAADLAAAAVACLTHPVAGRKTYFVSSPEIVSGRAMAQEIARQVGGWTFTLPLPVPAFWPLCLAAEFRTRITGKANVLSLQKYAELSAPGWVCDSGRIARELGFRCETNLKSGIAQTLEWYQRHHWI